MADLRNRAADLTQRMPGGTLGWGGLALAGMAAVMLAPRVPKLRKTVRLATGKFGGMTFRSGVSNPGVRATADPARGMPA